MTTSQHRSSGVLSTSAIHPVLKTALTSLDVSLDAELARYRRQKAGFAAPPPRGFHAPTSSGVMPSPGGAAPSNPAPPMAPSPRLAMSASQLGQNGARMPASTVTKPEEVRAGVTSTVAASTVAASSAVLAGSAVKPVQDTPAQSMPDRDPLTTATSLATPVISSPADPSLVTNDLDPSTIPSGAIQLVKPTVAASDHLDSAPTTLVHPGSSDPFDYLESSEELLKSLSEDEPDFTTISEQPNFFKSLLTPVGIGSSLILLLSTATLGYVFLMNASGQMGLKLSDSPQASAPSSGTESSSATSNKARAGLPNSPDLSSREFVDLNLNTLSTLKTNQSGASQPGASPLALQGAKPAGSQSNGLSALPSPVQLGSGTTTAITQLPIATAPFFSNDGRTIVAQPGTIATTTTPDPSQQVYTPDTTPASSQSTATAPRPATVTPRATVPAASRFPTPTQRIPQPTSASRSLPPAITTSPPAQSPSRATTPSSPAAVTSSPQKPPAPASNAASSPGYTVVSPYTGDRNLEDAQRVVPDAYVRNYPDGARVQLGSYNDPEKARSVVEQLQRQGIDAQIQQP